MTQFTVGATVQVLRAAVIPDRFNTDETVEDWDHPIQIGPDYPRTPIAPQQLIDSPLPDQPLRQSDKLMAILPYGAPISGTDRIRVLSGPYAGTYRINGKPGHWENPFTGWRPGCIVILEDLP